MSTAAQKVRDLLEQDRPLVLGGVYDGLSTRIAHRAGFEVLFIGGFSVAATLLGEPDFGYLTQTEMADTARRVCRLTDRPVLVDADTGYGNALNVIRTVRLYQEAGAAGLFLEDQVWPKRCGHMSGKRIVERGEWLGKLRAVLEMRGERDLFELGDRLGCFDEDRVGAEVACRHAARDCLVETDSAARIGARDEEEVALATRLENGA